ncbi:MAG TPA: sigma-70 family RNA polymerase sigma factor [Planctomycetota bacterium]|nr:sigma-70 family RNA polymerase sigma factor [Planctomycetota bacterium]
MLPKTNTVLLAGLLEAGNDEVWRDFDGRYRPVLRAFASRLGLAPNDAEEVAQETLAQFVELYRAGKYDRERGRLRSWIFGIAQRRVADVRRARERRRERRGESALEPLTSEPELERLFEEEWQRALLAAAFAELRAGRTDPQSIRALELLASGSRSADEVATELSMTPNAVYAAKHRAVVKLREILTRLDRDW